MKITIGTMCRLRGGLGFQGPIFVNNCSGKGMLLYKLNAPLLFKFRLKEYRPPCLIFNRDGSNAAGQGRSARLPPLPQGGRSQSLMKGLRAQERVEWMNEVGSLEHFRATREGSSVT